MDNSGSRRFDDEVLYAFLDAEIDAETAALIAASPAVLSRVERLRSEQRRLRSAFHRVDCPDVDVLLDLAAGRLAPEREREIADHLAECPSCTEEAASIVGFHGAMGAPLSEAAVSAGRSIAGRVRSIVATLLSGPGLAPGLAGARAELRGNGPEDAEPWIFEADDVMLTLVAGRDAARPERIELTGQVSGPDAAGWWAAVFADAAGLEVPGDSVAPTIAVAGTPTEPSTGAPSDSREEEGETPDFGEPVSTVVDAVSTFALGGLAPGRYRLILRGDDRRIEVSGLELL